MLLDGIDLSDLGSGYTYIGGSNVSNRTVMQNCKINGSVTAIAERDRSYPDFPLP